MLNGPVQGAKHAGGNVAGRRIEEEIGTYNGRGGEGFEE